MKFTTLFIRNTLFYHLSIKHDYFKIYKIRQICHSFPYNVLVQSYNLMHNWEVHLPKKGKKSSWESKYFNSAVNWLFYFINGIKTILFSFLKMSTVTFITLIFRTKKGFVLHLVVFTLEKYDGHMKRK